MANWIFFYLDRDLYDRSIKVFDVNQFFKYHDAISENKMHEWLSSKGTIKYHLYRSVLFILDFPRVRMKKL